MSRVLLHLGIFHHSVLLLSLLSKDGNGTDEIPSYEVIRVIQPGFSTSSETFASYGTWGVGFPKE